MTRLAVHATACALLGAVACESGSVGGRSEPIVAGETADDLGVVAVLTDAGDLCSGSIVGSRVVLTAKHCFPSGATADVDAVRIVVGASVEEPNAEFNVLSILPAGDCWDDCAWPVDVALLVLTTDASPTPITLGQGDPAHLEGDLMRAVGYGITATGDSGVRRSTNVTVAEVGGGAIQTPAVTCAGDSGGPLLDADGISWGVASQTANLDGGGVACGEGVSVFQSLQGLGDWVLSVQSENEGRCELGGDPCPDGFVCHGSGCVGRCVALDEIMTPSCRRDADLCAAAEVCSIADDDTCGTCVDESTSVGLRARGEECTEDADCTTGLCARDGNLFYCSRACIEDGQCGDGRHCKEEVCVRGERDACQRIECNDPCLSNRECPARHECVRDDGTVKGNCRIRGGDCVGGPPWGLGFVGVWLLQRWRARLARPRSQEHSRPGDKVPSDSVPRSRSVR